MTPEDQARLDYMEWFVKRHYLIKDLKNWGSTRLLKYYTDLIETAERFNGMNHHDWCYPRSAPNLWVNITDLKSDTPPTDPQVYDAWVDYQAARHQYEQHQKLWWLEAEAEFYLITAEAALRSYGVPVIS